MAENVPCPFACGKVEEGGIVREDGRNQDLVTEHAMDRSASYESVRSSGSLLLVQVLGHWIIGELDHHGTHDGNTGVGGVNRLRQVNLVHVIAQSTHLGV
jgi:hypothetical protein